jgi:dTDP-4-amino-4,6-dideoxygalactose transaminase
MLNHMIKDYVIDTDIKLPTPSAIINTTKMPQASPGSQMIEFSPSLATSGQFSAISFAATPELKINELSWSPNSTDTSNLLFTHSGGTALAIAGHRLKQDTNIILVPSYHCPAAIEPFMWLDYQCLFYRVNSDLSPDRQHIEQLVSEHQISHCLLINYFGVTPYPKEIAEALQAQGIRIIYDCAHAMFEVLKNTTEVVKADAIICSINKLLPSIDGGILLLKTPDNKGLSKIPWWPELKAVSYSLGLTQVINKLRTKLVNKETKASPCPDSTKSSSTNAVSYRYFRPSQVEQCCFSHTISLTLHSNLELIKARRRENYLYLANLLSQDNQKAGRVLCEQLSQDIVPYVLPFILNDAKDFNHLRQAGIQSLRWEEIAITDCEISNRYRHCLVQLPCHHQLSNRELQAIANTLKEI